MTLPWLTPRALGRLIHATLVALALLTLGSGAKAAVPMCSEDGRSVAAPPVMKPSSGRVLESPGDCERLRALLTNSNSGDDQRGGALQGGDAPLRALPARTFLPEAPSTARVDVTVSDGRVRPGAVEELLRPPIL